MANELTRIKRYKRRYIICVLIMLVISSVILNFIFFYAYEPAKCKEKTMHTYVANIDVLNSISDFMKNNDFKSMYIDLDEIDKGILTRDPYKGNVYIPINPEIKMLIDESQCKSVSKRGNSIYYLVEIWMSTGHGLAYSLDGDKPDSVFIEETEHLGDNWYYYKSK